MIAEFDMDLIENRLWLDDQTHHALATARNGGGARKLGQRAVVIGAGMGGLSAAGALAEYFERVEILERDRLTGSAASRSGTPQDRHPHGLLAGGLRALDQIFPGYKRDLVRARSPVRAAGCWRAAKAGFWDIGALRDAAADRAGAAPTG